MPINTLNAATQGYLPSKTPLSMSTLGWLGQIASLFIEDNIFSWSLRQNKTDWNITRSGESWNMYSRKTVWKVPKEEE